jgi:glycosyltransferase involved in cell wall biosynthesis
VSFRPVAPPVPAPVKVVHIITRLELGGAQRNTLFTVANLDRARFLPVLVTGPGGILMEEARALGVPLEVAPSLARPLSPLRDLAAFREVRALLRRRHPDAAIVHTHSSKAGIVGRWAARSAGAPVIVHTIHGWGVTPGQGGALRTALLLAERATARVTTRFVAVSRKNLEDGVAWGVFARERCTVIRSGVDLAAFAAAVPDRAGLERETGIPADAPLVLMPACLKPQKDPLAFVAAAALVARDHPRARFAVAGDGEMARAVRDEAERLGLAGVFHLLGWRFDLPSLVAGAAVVVLTSRWEGLPQVIPQARAAGRPLVVTAVDGSPEAVSDGVSGFLVPPGDPGAAAARISQLLSDPALARRMGEAGRRGLEEFGREAMVRAQEKLYLELLAERETAR